MPENTSRQILPGQEHYTAPVEETPLQEVDSISVDEKPSSFWRDAWLQLRPRPIFWISLVLIIAVVIIAAFPSLFTSVDPQFGELRNSEGPPQPGHPFGFDRQGHDIFARVIFGARASVMVGLLTTFLVVIIGATVGAIAGFYGGFFDTLLSRITDIFFAIPLVLAAIVTMQMFKGRTTIWTVIVVLGAFGWPPIARITRGATMSIKNNEFVTAAKALGLSRGKILIKHILPNAAAPIIVYATVAFGTFIVAEATLSFLGIGLPPSIVSWGADISYAQTSLRSNPMVLFYPAVALAITVLSFILMGDAVRDALDPKAKKK